MAVPTW